MEEIGRYHLDGAALVRMARGELDDGSLRTLRESRASRVVQLVLLALDSEWGARSNLPAVYDLLARAHAREPAGVIALLASPWIGVWAADTARYALRTPSDPRPDPDPGYANAVALAAAGRAGLTATLPLPVRGALVPIPTSGAFVLDERRSGVVPVSVTAGIFDVGGGRWRPTPTVATSVGDARLAVQIEDTDPYRDCHDLVLARLPADGRVDRWRAAIEDGWRLIAARAPAAARELAAVPLSIVPATAGPGGAGRSATCADAFGGFAMSVPADGTEFAVCLIHEFCHSKLNAAHELEPLWWADASERHFAPWRRDPRPVGHLLHGCYAFLQVASWWSMTLTGSGGVRGRPSSPVAEERFALLREQVRRGLDGLRGTSALTDAGRLFADALDGRLSELYDVPVPPTIVQGARRAVAAAEVRWHERTAIARP